MKDTVELLPDEVDVFAPMLQSDIITNEFHQDFAPIAAITPGAAIEFHIEGKDQHYLDLNDSYMTVRAKITKADGTVPTTHHVAPVNLPLHSMFAHVSAQLNGKQVAEINDLYPYRAYMETVLSFNDQVQNTRLVAEGWKKDLTGKMNVADPAGDNTGLKARELAWDVGRETELIGRPHLDIFQQGRLIPPKVHLDMKFIPAEHKFVLMTDQAELFKLVIVSVVMTIRMKQLTSQAELAHRELVRTRPMKLPYSRVQMSVRNITIGLQEQDFDNLFTGALPDLAVIGMVEQDNFLGAYTQNPFYFQNFGCTNMELQRNGISVPRQGYKVDFAENSTKYMRGYHTLEEELGLHKSEKSLNISPKEWADGYNFYAFKITDGPIGSGTVSPRARAISGSARLKISFAAAVTATIKVVILSQSLGLLEFDEFKNVVTS